MRVTKAVRLGVASFGGGLSWFPRATVRPFGRFTLFHSSSPTSDEAVADATLVVRATRSGRRAVYPSFELRVSLSRSSGAVELAKRTPIRQKRARRAPEPVFSQRPLQPVITITAALDSSEQDELLSQNSTRLALAPTFCASESGYPSEATMQGSEGEESIDRRSKSVREESLLVSCTWCERLHAAEDPLEFNRVCPECAALPRASPRRPRPTHR